MRHGLSASESAFFSGRLGDRLLAEGLISEAQLETALERKRQTGEFLGELVVELGYASSRTIGKILQEGIGISYVDLADVQIDPGALELVAEHYQKRHRVLPYKVEDRRVYVAMCDPLNVMVVDDLHLMTGYRVVPQLVLNTDIQDAFNRVYSARSQAQEVLKEIEDAEEPGLGSDISADKLADLAEDAPIIRLTNSIIAGGVACGASDIHIEPQERAVRVRYRMDGVLYEQMTIPPHHYAAVCSRIKIMAHLNIAERRRPQDGRIVFKAQNAAYDLRVSTMPTIYGEKVVMRVLDKSGITVPLERLGFGSEQLALYETFITRPYGMVLVTGPTGSGKSTTLYASLNKINDVALNIITVEDPVEYNLAGISQMQANPRIGLTFATGLRTIVRQDPDVIMVGEIRDAETAEIAVQAALTGHLVFSTLHTNDAPGAVVRLQNMGVEPFLIVSALIGVVGQRLLRRNCVSCAEADTPNPALLRSLGISPEMAETAQYKRGLGCPKCSGRGYRGRSAAYEVMRVSDRLREAVLRNVGGSALKEIAMADGMTTMRESGIRKVLQGETTPEEVCRVLLSEEFGEGGLPQARAA
ncbi:MAG TPA: ATPase, T2SS/T4P/T4SS family [Chthonomonadales bacterium]|nr:ATPase, T2SS/T4P/T4SS family [Chthonomonadales bacterium]